MEANTPPYNAGFVSGVWYSKVPFFNGETIRIYTAFQNRSEGDIIGTVEFFDNNTSIGKANFSALNDRLIETWIDWNVTYGNHVISAKIVEAKRAEAGKPLQKIEVLASESKSEIIFTENIPLPPQPKIELSPAEIVIQTVSKISSTVVEGMVNVIDKFVPYSAAPLVVPVVVSAIPVVLSTATGGGGGGNGSDTTILNTADGYTQNLLQIVDAQRRKIKSDIKNIDEMHKKIDADRDGLVGLADFNALMINWGKIGTNIADYNQDEIVDLVDFNILMIYWS